jgi:hypothetical protein
MSTAMLARPFLVGTTARVIPATGKAFDAPVPSDGKLRSLLRVVGFEAGPGTELRVNGRRATDVTDVKPGDEVMFVGQPTAA